jgi:hypothetical protein
MTPQFQLFRNGSFDQAALLSSDSARPRQGPLAPRALPRFLATMGLSDSRHGRLPVIGSHKRWRHGHHRAGSPRFLDATVQARPPLSPRGALRLPFARCFTAGGRLHHLWQAGHTHKCNEAEPGSLALGLTRSQSGRLLPSPCLSPKGGDRPASRARLP